MIKSNKKVKGFYMKKQLKVIGFAALVAFVAVSGASAVTTSMVDETGLCKLIDQFKGIFNLLRTLAFIGAGFLIAKWAWGYIEAGKIDAMKEVKEKGVSMLIGFILLFGIGVVLQVLGSATGADMLGCVTTGW